MRTGILVIVIVCTLLILSTFIPISRQSDLAGVLLLCLALTMIYCLGSNWRYFRGNMNFRKGAYLLIHLGFIMLVLAGLVGMHGEEFTLELRERQQVNLAPYHRSFQVRADEIRAEYYPSGLPRQYYTVLSFLDEETAISIQTTSVNHPVFFRGLYFYQSEYTASPEKMSVLTVKTQPERPYLWVGFTFLSLGILIWFFGKVRTA